MLATNGGRFGGYGLYLLKGKPVFTYNGVDVARFRWAGRKPLRRASTPSCLTSNTRAWSGKGGTVIRLTTSRSQRGNPSYSSVHLAFDETFDVGGDTRKPVDDRDYQVPFTFTGKLNKLTIKVGPEQLAEADQQVIREALARSRD